MYVVIEVGFNNPLARHCVIVIEPCDKDKTMTYHIQGAPVQDPFSTKPKYKLEGEIDPKLTAKVLGTGSLKTNIVGTVIKATIGSYVIIFGGIYGELVYMVAPPLPGIDISLRLLPPVHMSGPVAEKKTLDYWKANSKTKGIYLLEDGYDYDKTYADIAKSTPSGGYRLLDNNCCHWVEKVIKKVKEVDPTSYGQWPFRNAINFGTNPGNSNGKFDAR